MTFRRVCSAVCVSAAISFAAQTAAATPTNAGTDVYPAASPSADQPQPSPSESDDAIHRHGFTLQLSLGAGMAHMMPSDGTGYDRGGLGGMNLMLGGFLSPDVALVAKIAGVNWGPFDDDAEQGLAGGIGPALQYWLSDHVNVVGGFGLGFVAAGNADQLPAAGFAGLIGLNVLPFALERHGFGLSLDFVPVFTDEGNALTFQGGVSWQFY